MIKEIVLHTCKNLPLVGKVSNIEYRLIHTPKLTVQMDLISPQNQTIVQTIEEDIQASIF